MVYFMHVYFSCFLFLHCTVTTTQIRRPLSVLDQNDSRGNGISKSPQTPINQSGMVRQSSFNSGSSKCNEHGISHSELNASQWSDINNNNFYHAGHFSQTTTMDSLYSAFDKIRQKDIFCNKFQIGL